MKDIKDEIIEKQEKLIDWLSIRLNDLDSFDMYNQLTFDLNRLKSELFSLHAGEKGEKLTEEEAMKAYPDLCFCKLSTYERGVCTKCGKLQD